ncbi:cyclase family protein [Bernardetia sp.]|uniref:cyclase family protein n=1 Tax=Bernardetia sp. TaxID=1937974 RepID=UPI0025C48DC5|nr:cyclase family protein [Bernardetia sp.]
MKKETNIDVTLDLSYELPLWTGSKGMQLEFLQKISDTQFANVSQLNIELHTGTHVDAPSHFIKDGKNVEALDLDILIGEAWVAYLPNIKKITAQDLENAGIPKGTTRLLLKTTNSELWKKEPYPKFQTDFVALTKEAAKWVVSRNIRLVGIDYLSIQLYDDGPETHQILLSQEIVIIETLNLNQVEQGKYELICLPLKIKGAEASPARVILKPI